MSVFVSCPHCGCACAVIDELRPPVFCQYCGQALEGDPPTARRGSEGAEPRPPLHSLASLLMRVDPLVPQMIRHIEATIGLGRMAIHDSLTSEALLTIHVIPPVAQSSDSPSPPRNHFTLVTTGLSLTCPSAFELMLSLPAGWPGLRTDGMLDPAAMAEDKNFWPIACVKAAARQLHQQQDASRLFPNGSSVETAAPIAPGLAFTGCIALPSVLHPASHQFTGEDGRTITFLALYPAHADEMQFGEARGVDQLQSLFISHHISDLVDVERPSIVPTATRH